MKGSQQTSSTKILLTERKLGAARAITPEQKRNEESRRERKEKSKKNCAPTGSKIAQRGTVSCFLFRVCFHKKSLVSSGSRDTARCFWRDVGDADLDVKVSPEELRI